MRNRNTKYYVYIIIGILVAAIGYTACKNITPPQTEVTETIQLKLTK